MISRQLFERLNDDSVYYAQQIVKLGATTAEQVAHVIVGIPHFHMPLSILLDDPRERERLPDVLRALMPGSYVSVIMASLPGENLPVLVYSVQREVHDHARNLLELKLPDRAAEIEALSEPDSWHARFITSMHNALAFFDDTRFFNLEDFAVGLARDDINTLLLVEESWRTHTADIDALTRAVRRHAPKARLRVVPMGKDSDVLIYVRDDEAFFEAVCSAAKIGALMGVDS